MSKWFAEFSRRSIAAQNRSNALLMRRAAVLSGIAWAVKRVAAVLLRFAVALTRSAAVLRRFASVSKWFPAVL